MAGAKAHGECLPNNSYFSVTSYYQHLLSFEVVPENKYDFDIFRLTHFQEIVPVTENSGKR